MLSSQVRRLRCAICWGPLVLKWIEGDRVVVCPKGCQGDGHVSEDYVTWRRAKDAADAAQVAANYPELAGPSMTPDEIAKNTAALWPKEEEDHANPRAD
jgi:hypothetical protein